MTRRRLTLFALAAWLSGCVAAPQPRPSSAATVAPVAGVPTPPPAGHRDYILQPGDVLEIKMFYNPDLNERLPVRPDGKISLQLVGEVEAAGRTAGELSQHLESLYGKDLRQPEVTVIVKEFAGYRIFIGGEVETPGIVRPVGTVTVRQAIVEAGGFKSTAHQGSVVILRDQGTPEPRFILVDLRVDAARGTAGQDIQLEPNDIVFVPQTRIARLDQLVDQYFRQLVPISLSMGVSYVFGDRVFR